MLKTKLKVVLLILLISMFMCSSCFAETPEDEVLLSATDGEPVVTTASESTENSEQDLTSLLDDYTASWTNGDLFVIDDKVTVSNVVDGNAFIMGNEVTITGEIGGDVFVMAQKLNIEGAYIYNNLFAMAEEINIDGIVYDVYAMANTFTLKSEGYVYRDLKVAGNTVNLNGKIRRNVDLDCNSLHFGEDSGTVVYGDLNYTSNSEFSIPENSVAGTTNFSKSESFEGTSKSVNVLSVIKDYLLDLLGTLLFTFVIAILLVWLAPKFVERLSSMNTAKSFISLGIGVGSVVSTIILAILAIFLLITVILAPFVLVGALLITIIFVLGNSIASIFFGKLFAKLLKVEGKVKFMLLTLGSCLVIWIINQIPFIGGFLGFFIWAFGVGSLLFNLFAKKQKTEVEEAN